MGIIIRSVFGPFSHEIFIYKTNIKKTFPIVWTKIIYIAFIFTLMTRNLDKILFFTGFLKFRFIYTGTPFGVLHIELFTDHYILFEMIATV